MKSLFSNNRHVPFGGDQLDRYLAGQAEPRDVQVIHAWIQAEPEWASLVRHFRQLGRSGEPHWDVDRGWQELMRQVTAKDSPVIHKRPLPWRRVVVSALGAAVTLAACLYVARGLEQRRDMAVVTTSTYTTSLGQMASLRLPDGSSVLLAPGSTMRYVQHVNGVRRIDLRGQGRFTVVHAPETPFLVSTGMVETQVLGTVFDVSRYANDSVARVAVLDGRVAASSPRGTVALHAGMAAVAGDSIVPIVNQQLGDSVWTRGELVFTEANVADVLVAATRWSGYRFRLMDSTLASRRVSTTLPVHQPATMVRVLEDLLNVRATIVEKTITLSSGRASHRETPDRRRVPDWWMTRAEVGR